MGLTDGLDRGREKEEPRMPQSASDLAHALDMMVYFVLCREC